MDFETARKRKRISLRRLAKESGYKVNFVRKLIKGKYPITQATKRVFDPILDSDLTVGTKLCEELKLLEKEIQKELDCVVDHCENLVVATAFKDGKRERTVLRMNQLELDNPLAIRNEAKGFIFELEKAFLGCRIDKSHHYGRAQ